MLAASVGESGIEAWYQALKPLTTHILGRRRRFWFLLPWAAE